MIVTEQFVKMEIKTSMEEKIVILVSACLAGLKVRYNGTDCVNDRIQQLIADKKAITVCPEVLGGLSTPRDPAEIIGGNGDDVLDGKAIVQNIAGKDVTDEFIKGAYVTLKKAQEVGATTVILKESSPSCGSNKIYNGKFNGQKMVGMGVTAALLRRNNITVLSDEQLESFLNNYREYTSLDG